MPSGSAPSSSTSQAEDALNPAYRRAFARARRAAGDILKQRFRMVRLVREAYAKMGHEEKALRAVLGDLSTLLRLARAYATRAYRDISGKSMLYVVGALLYFLSPVDVIPDFLPGVGYLDDIAVISAAVQAVRGDLDAFRAWEEAQRDAGRTGR